MDTASDTGPLALLLQKMRVINRISSALSGSLAPSDVHALILSALVSQRGLGYTRAILLTHNPKTLRFEGHLALGPQSPEELEAFDREMAAEEEALDRIHRRQPQGAGGGDSCAGNLALTEMLNDLKASTVWVATIQSSAEASELTRAVQGVSWACPEGETDAPDLLAQAATNRQSLHCLRPTPGAALPPPLDGILDDEFVIVPITTRKGLRALILADRKFRPRPMDSEDIQLLEWFRGQASLALENAELFSHLTAALNDLKEMDHLKTGFLSIISHELRTPLTAILGICDLLMHGRAGEISPKQAELLERALKRGALLSDMINDLLQIAEIEAKGLVDLDMEEVDPLSALLNALQKVEPRRANKQITVNTHLPDGPPPVIRSNQTALERILYHLLDNAIKFSRPGASVEAGFHLLKDTLAITIEDTGDGIAPENMGRIFDPFFQADQRLTRRHEGIGIGLTISQKLAHALSGQITIKSKPGKGAIFTVTFSTQWQPAY
ncbi:MAG: ATP-binding protein [Candidatus Sumerlaeota bacterium]|nr:ATP-binding protein [Candidatus Sumerlaeota bacterium]